MQYSFASKDLLIQALVKRWTNNFSALIEASGPADTATGMVRRNLDAAQASAKDIDTKIAGVVTVLSLDPQNRAEMRA